jgi:hypothetical protein
LRSVGEEVVAEVLDGFPAVPFQRTSLSFPRGWGRLVKDCHSELHGKVEVVRGDGGLGEGNIV